jgi:hypothetical protein
MPRETHIEISTMYVSTVTLRGFHFPVPQLLRRAGGTKS